MVIVLYVALLLSSCPQSGLKLSLELHFCHNIGNALNDKVSDHRFVFVFFQFPLHLCRFIQPRPGL